jgi:hypothetical protein
LIVSIAAVNASFKAWSPDVLATTYSANLAFWVFATS